MKLYWRLLGFVKPYRGLFALAILTTMLSSATEPLVPILLKPLLDEGFAAGQRPDYLWKLPLGVVGLFLFRGVFGYIASMAFTKVSSQVIEDIRRAMYERLLHLPDEVLRKHSISHYVTKFTNDVTLISDAVVNALNSLLRDVVTITGLLAWLIYLNWRLTLICFVLLPLVAWVVKQFSLRMRRIGRDAIASNAQMMQVVQETVQNQRVIKLFSLFPVMTSRFAMNSQRLRQLALKHNAAAAATVPISQLFSSIALAVVMTIALHQSMNQQTTVGAFVSFITAMLMLLAPMKRLADMSSPLQRGLAAAESLFGLLDEPVEHDVGQQRLTSVQGRIVFEQVGFAYGEQSILRDISLEIQPGETLALVGPSGGGKSTLVALIPRLLIPTAGRLLLDGRDLQSIELASLRQHIAYVSQETLLFDDTIACNIAWGANMEPSSRSGMEAIRAAAERAHALAFIEALPEGFETRIGEGGLRLSGGQRQRIAIARALLKNAPILILDEATSALDNESEKAVQAALDTLMQNRTTLVIAHRLSTIVNANRIAVIDQGCVVELGTHAELLAYDGVYAQLQRGVSRSSE